MGAGVDAYEQWVLELVNRARLDPWGEAARLGIDLNQGLATGTLDGHARAPLAGNLALADAAGNHSAWMLATDTFSHTGAGGSDPGQRMMAAGYAFTGSWTWGENIAYNGTTGGLDLFAATLANHDGLFRSAGHRLNILSDAFKEAGIGAETGQFGAFNAQTLTESFATSGAGSFVTGVGYDDGNHDGFYSVGEGLGGIGVTLLQNGAALAATSTAGAGGYAARTLLTGTVDVQFSGGGLAHAVTAAVWMGGGNVKLDVVDGGDRLLSSGYTTLKNGALNLDLLGVANLNAYGNAAANAIDGNAGSNSIWGGAGDDALHGHGGNDTLAGDYGNDRLDGGAGDDLADGGAGNDALYTYEGRDTLLGGDGDDQVFTVPNVPVTIDGGAGYDVAYVVGWEAAGRSVDLGSSMYGFANVEVRAAWMAGGNDTVYGSGGVDYLFGNGGDDLLFGNSGNDVIDGGDGGDAIYAGTGSDYMISSAGFDSYHFEQPSDLVAGEFDMVAGFKDASPGGNDVLVFASALQGSLYLYDYAGFGAMISVQVAGGWWTLGLQGVSAAQVSDQIAYV